MFECSHKFVLLLYIKIHTYFAVIPNVRVRTVTDVARAGKQRTDAVILTRDSETLIHWNKKIQILDFLTFPRNWYGMTYDKPT